MAMEKKLIPNISKSTATKIHKIVKKKKQNSHCIQKKVRTNEYFNKMQIHLL